MAGARTKKAKLAHEKQKPGQVSKGRSFAIASVVEIVKDKSGFSGAIVDIDGLGTMGIVDADYTTKDSDGNLTPRGISCPATYDPVAQQQAIERYQAHAAA
ncbi:MAG: hypothetical protein ACI9MR_000478 [Myxococcota bacterium]|jgi:hypothetical protein